MNEQISWDASLVKKFSTSNHYKLINQLRNEVKKYPLNKKKNITESQINDKIINNKNQSNSSNSQDLNFNKSNVIKKETTFNASTVSFNNSKNFSIYNNKDSKKTDNENMLMDDGKSQELPSGITFKDRLEQIDMK
tara:strand:- start:90 stop:497 length:408 start_codon:yes stop_codon:yes gene_type:complete